MAEGSERFLFCSVYNIFSQFFQNTARTPKVNGAAVAQTTSKIVSVLYFTFLHLVGFILCAALAGYLYWIGTGLFA